jgi:hypothetical protein
MNNGSKTTITISVLKDVGTFFVSFTMPHLRIEFNGSVFMIQGPQIAKFLASKPSLFYHISHTKVKVFPPRSTGG